METYLVNEFHRQTAARRAPAYQHLRRTLQHAIENGELTPGQALPGERELAKLLDLSRVTVRNAISGLVGDGLLVQRQGAGTFVAERIVKSFSKLTSFTDDLRARGLDPRSTFLERGVGEVTPDEAMALNLSPGAQVVRYYRLRIAGDMALALERTVVPQSVLADPSLVENSLYETFSKLGLRPARALQRLRAIAFDAEQARLMNLPEGSPGLFIERRTFLEDGRVVEYTRSFYRGDAYDFVAELQTE
ncbi:MAG TPA: GntR family transcriptional regulator [Lysobacter sp.]|jgi:GntR family transcriptional regulator|uniref:GntR family transcriptional regulator n=1 Tax=Lysobacter niastensis TaxID=380629 RepID=A0ABU1WDU7_9GAMM|nr:GntR family transcriptional regulator [Lysobacter niastensis]MDR7135709.1 GntR family transcriptional regulator [Lysobacter niastensis]